MGGLVGFLGSLADPLNTLGLQPSNKQAGPSTQPDLRQSRVSGITASGLDKQSDKESEVDDLLDSTSDRERDGAFPNLRERGIERSTTAFDGINKLREQSDVTRSTLGNLKGSEDAPDIAANAIDTQVFNRLTEDAPDLSSDVEEITQSSNVIDFAIKNLQQIISGRRGTPKFGGLDSFNDIPELSLDTKPKTFRSRQLELLMENT